MQNQAPLHDDIDALLALPITAFLSAVYRRLLAREPDVPGVSFYMRRFACGYSKTAILAEIADSTEASSTGATIDGLADLLHDFRLSRHWLRGRAARKRLLQRDINRIEHKLDTLLELPTIRCSTRIPTHSVATNTYQAPATPAQISLTAADGPTALLNNFRIALTASSEAQRLARHAHR